MSPHDGKLAAYVIVSIAAALLGAAFACVQAPAPPAQGDSGWHTANVTPGFDAGSGALR